jgi:predicted DNA-binding helix-hairpin-helix protein
MNNLDKLVCSTEAMTFEAEGHPLHPSNRRKRKSRGYSPAELRKKYGEQWDNRVVHIDGRSIPVTNAVLSAGKRIPLLKAMLSTVCERNCRYCPFQSGRDFHRVTFSADDMAQTFFKLYQMDAVEGIFLSAGVVRGGSITQNKLLDTAEILRHKLGYQGYLHLKIMPGAERDQVLQAMQLADRVSTNLEAPNQHHLSQIAPMKQFHEELLQSLLWIDEIRRNRDPDRSWNQRWPSSSTQFVVGATGESDLEILNLVENLFKHVGLTRTYFEAFDPVPGTPLENHTPTDPLRQHRLYQASYLIRDYGFDFEEISFSGDGFLPIDCDPKLAYAQATLAESPVEINRADRAVLLRVPGIGPKGAASILKTRNVQIIRELGDLRKIGVLSERAAPYITLDGQRPPVQRKLL